MERAAAGRGGLARPNVVEGLTPSTSLPTDAARRAMHCVSYTAFGEPITPDGQGGWRVGFPVGGGGMGVPPVNRYQYAGGWGYETGGFDGQSGILALYGGKPDLPPITLQHVGWRWYQPSAGRFIQRDPIGIDGGLNVYAYCFNDPVGWIDPTGFGQYWDEYGPNWGEIDKAIDGVVNGKVGGAVGAGSGAATAANFKWRLGIGKVTNRLTVICAAFWIGWNGGKLIDKAIEKAEWGPLRGNFCFIGGSLVHASAGLVPIEDLRERDHLWSGAPDGECGEAAILRISVGQTQDLVEVAIEGETLQCTFEHPFFVVGTGWKRARDLASGDMLLDITGQPTPVLEVCVHHLEEAVSVYNVEVSNWHTFYVGHRGILVHNKNAILD